MANAATALYIIAAVSLFMLMCAVFNICRRDALTEQRALRVKSVEELELQRTQRKEQRLQSSIQRLRAALSRKERDLQDTSDSAALLTARLEEASDPELARRRAEVEERDMAAFDERGRAMYGAAWDEGYEDGLPLREVFLMDDKEAAELRAMARKRMEEGGTMRVAEANRGLPAASTHGRGSARGARGKRGKGGKGGKRGMHGQSGRHLHRPSPPTPGQGVGGHGGNARRPPAPPSRRTAAPAVPVLPLPSSHRRRQPHHARHPPPHHSSRAGLGGDNTHNNSTGAAAGTALYSITFNPHDMDSDPYASTAGPMAPSSTSTRSMPPPPPRLRQPHPAPRSRRVRFKPPPSSSSSPPPSPSPSPPPRSPSPTPLPPMTSTPARPMSPTPLPRPSATQTAAHTPPRRHAATQPLYSLANKQLLPSTSKSSRRKRRPRDSIHFFQ